MENVCKKIIICAVLLSLPYYIIVGVTGCSCEQEVTCGERNAYTVTEYVYRDKINKDKLFEAFCAVESEGKDDAVNKTSGATGVVQIMPIMIDEANRIARTNKYNLSDRYSRKKSREIFHLIMGAKNPDYDIAQACYIWNPNGKTIYTHKVAQKYKELTDKRYKTK